MVKVIKCPLCGYKIAAQDRKSKCQLCPLNNCHLICCPNCNYTFPESSKIINLIRKKFKQEKEV